MRFMSVAPVRYVVNYTRRDALAGSALAVSVAAAGCLDFAAGDGPQGPEGTPATLTCEDDAFVRLDRPFEGSVAETLVETDETTVELSTEGTA